MKKTILICFAGFLFCSSPGFAGIFDDIIEGLGSASKGSSALPGSLDKTIAGLKEALSIGTVNAVTGVSQTDGYFGSEVIKILMPEKIQNVANMLQKVGYGKQVDDFVLSMNRAAENAAPKAKEYFIDAVKEMTFDDAQKILNGGDFAATEYLKSKTYDKLFDAFSPSVSASLDQVGGTRAYKEMMGTFTSLPFMSAESLDLNRYVTNKSLDGLFHMVGQEEKKIRTEPAARVTSLLKDVFGK